MFKREGIKLTIKTENTMFLRSNRASGINSGSQTGINLPRYSRMGHPPMTDESLKRRVHDSTH